MSYLYLKVRSLEAFFVSIVEKVVEFCSSGVSESRHRSVRRQFCRIFCNMLHRGLSSWSFNNNLQIYWYAHFVILLVGLRFSYIVVCKMLIMKYVSDDLEHQIGAFVYRLGMLPVDVKKKNVQVLMDSGWYEYCRLHFYLGVIEGWRGAVFQCRGCATESLWKITLLVFWLWVCDYLIIFIRHNAAQKFLWCRTRMPLQLY